MDDLSEKKEGKEEIVTKLTAQEALDQVVRGMKVQGWKQAVMGGNIYGTCKYRTNSGLRCAVGQLIPPEKYNPSMEGKGVGAALAMAGISVSADTLDMLILLQDVHDGSNSSLDMHRKFRRVADRYGLEFPADCLAAENVETL